MNWHPGVGVTCAHLLRTLEADPALRRAHAAVHGAGEGHRVQARLELRVLILERQAPRSWVRAIVLLFVIPGSAVERRPPAASNPESPHA